MFRIRLGERTEEIVALRLQLEAFPVNTVDDQRRKEELHRKAEAKLNDLRAAADHLVLSYLVDGLNDRARTAMRERLLDVLFNGHDMAQGDYDALLPAFQRNNPFHWQLEFPEVFLRERGGFDAFVGNPPFQGGQHLTGAHGTPYRDYLVETVANGKKGSADLCAYFFLRAYDALRSGGTFGLIATNTIAQGDSRDVGWCRLIMRRHDLPRRQRSRLAGRSGCGRCRPHLPRRLPIFSFCLDDRPVEFITPLLDDIAVKGRYLPHKLQANVDKSFQGSTVLGMGFVLPPDEAQALIDKDARNKDVLFPYLNGEDLNDQPEIKPTRWVINFFDWTEEQAMQYSDAYEIIHKTVYPERLKNNRDVYRSTGGIMAKNALLSIVPLHCYNGYWL
ncbi:MAG: hypothetical protein IPK19_41460 [Chloroflexi bacterium]|nr:hypothetical protein [Chloroflexota bacterium]